MQRDLTVGKHPMLIGRLWPQVLHHWTIAEFQSFLEQNKYPSNTWRDQQESRRQTAIEAMGKGICVPQEVLAEDSSIADDVHMNKASSLAWGRFNARVADLRAQFEVFIGYVLTMDLYRGRIKSLLADMLKQRQTLGRKQMSVVHQGWTLTLQAVDGRPAQISQFGAYGGRAKRVDIYEGKNSFGIADLHAISWDLVESVLTELLIEGSVSYDDIWFFTGVGWQPARTTIQVLTSKVGEHLPRESFQIPTRSGTIPGVAGLVNAY